jgi:hypothetical protein
MPAAIAAAYTGVLKCSVRPLLKVRVKVLDIAQLLPVVGFSQADDAALRRLTIKAINEPHWGSCAAGQPDWERV